PFGFPVRTPSGPTPGGGGAASSPPLLHAVDEPCTHTRRRSVRKTFSTTVLWAISARFRGGVGVKPMLHFVHCTFPKPEPMELYCNFLTAVDDICVEQNQQKHVEFEGMCLSYMDLFAALTPSP